MLLVSIYNIRYPVTADVLFTTFHKHGCEPQRIVIFPRSQGEQALIEFANHEQAQIARQRFDGRPMLDLYPDSQLENSNSGVLNSRLLQSQNNLMKVQFSELSSLEINQQNEKARDFTSLSLRTYVQSNIDESLAKRQN